jgi:hypothetical protein
VLVQDWVSPPAGSKNDVFRLQSVNSMAIAPAKTGRDSRRRSAVMATDHTNSGIHSGFMLIVVEIKLCRCREKMARSTLVTYTLRPKIIVSWVSELCSYNKKYSLFLNICIFIQL